MIDQEMMGALQGIVPSCIVTCSKAGVPNATYISQVYYVDDTHVALSHQFFNKTIRNVHENPHLAVVVVDADTFQNWYLEVQFDHEETEGALFDQMEMQLEAIASMTGMAGVFKLRAAHVYEVKSVKKLDNRKPA